MNFVDVLRHRQGQPATGGAGDDGAGQHVRGYLVQGSGQAQYLVRVHPLTGGDHVGQDRVPAGQRAGLVEQHDVTAGQPFQGATALDDYPGLRGPAQAGHDRDRGGQQQRARGRDHKHGHSPHGLPAERPARPREDERERHEGDREPVGGANEGSRGSLGLLDQAHHPGVGGLGGQCGGDQVDRLARVDHTAADILAGEPLDRQRLPSQGRLVQHRGGAKPSINRDDLPGAHQQQVTDDDLVNRDLHDPTLADPSSRARGPLDQQAQLTPGPLGGPGLQKLAAGQHHRDHGACERFVDHDGAGQGQDRDDVDAELAAPDRLDGPQDGEDQAQPGAQQPQDARGGRGGQPRQASGEQQHRRHPKEHGFLACAQTGHHSIVRHLDRQ